MGETSIDTKPIGKPKALLFGEALRRAIKQEFGTNREFAAHLGVTEGRVSQLLSGAEGITAQSLEPILATFADVGLQAQVHEAWVETYVPLPIVANVDEVERLLASRHNLIAAGKARQTLTTLQTALNVQEDRECRRRIMRACIEFSLFLGRSTQALRGAEKLVEEAKRSNEPSWIAVALWLKASAARTSPAHRSSEVARIHEEVAQFIGAWNPASVESKAILLDIKEAVLRDKALAMLTLHERKPLDGETLQLAIAPLDRFLERDLLPHTRAIFLEVKGRVILAKDDAFLAEEVLEEATANRNLNSGEQAIKSGILKGQILIARSELEAAEQVLLEVQDQCFLIDALHHATVAERHLARLRI